LFGTQGALTLAIRRRTFAVIMRAEPMGLSARAFGTAFFATGIVNGLRNLIEAPSAGRKRGD
jgi:hypothetical protein